MSKQKDIRSRIHTYIDQHQISMAEFSKRVGMNRGNVSTVMNHRIHKLLSLKQFDQVSAVLGFTHGELYPLYIDECFYGTVHWGKIREFLFRCAEWGLKDHIQTVIQRLSEDLKHIPEIFNTAEGLFEQGYHESAQILYETVVDSEKQHLSERLAMSYYRLFKIDQNNIHKNLKVATQFLPYRGRLRESLALDGFISLAHLFIVREEWKEVEVYVGELYDLSQALFKNKTWKSSHFHSIRPFVYYYGQSYLLKSSICVQKQDYEQALAWTEKYADLSGMIGVDIRDQQEVLKLSQFATANRLLFRIKLGDQTVISSYVSFMRCHPKEIIKGLTTLLEFANIHHYDMDQVLEEFNIFTDQVPSNLDANYNEAFQYFNKVLFYKQYAIYLLKKQNYESGLQILLEGIKISKEIENQEILNKLAILFEVYRAYATLEQNNIYTMICRKECEDEKQNYHLEFPACSG